MRNIRIADRKDWVFEAPPPVQPPSTPSRSKDWLATLPILLLVPVLMFPFMAISAGGPTLEVNGGSVSPGSKVSVKGRDFSAGEAGIVAWQDDAEALGEYTASDRGRFTVRIRC